jgi:hypothetical protein
MRTTNTDMPGYDPRDFVGYGQNPPNPKWPNGARIAVQIALNYEAGAETNTLYGDATSEFALADMPAMPVPGELQISKILADLDLLPPLALQRDLDYLPRQ